MDRKMSARWRTRTVPGWTTKAEKKAGQEECPENCEDDSSTAHVDNAVVFSIIKLALTIRGRADKAFRLSNKLHAVTGTLVKILRPGACKQDIHENNTAPFRQIEMNIQPYLHPLQTPAKGTTSYP